MSILAPCSARRSSGCSRHPLANQLACTFRDIKGRQMWQPQSFREIVGRRFFRPHGTGGITMHPLRKLRESGNATAAQVSTLLAENVVFNSPILVRPVQGREVIAAIFAQSSSTRGSGNYTAEFKLDDRTTFLRWVGTMDGHKFEGLAAQDIPPRRAAKQNRRALQRTSAVPLECAKCAMPRTWWVCCFYCQS
jgi:hypothetical protein